MRVLVLGGTGFIGSYVVEALQAAGHEVRVLARGVPDQAERWAKVDCRTGNLSDRETLAAALEGVEAVVHSASTTVVATAQSDPMTDVSGNLLGTLCLLEEMERGGVRRLVFLSSGGTVYGLPEVLPIPESHPLRPMASYCIVKAAIEAYVAERVRQGLVAVVIRVANPYGPRQKNLGIQGFIGTAMERLKRNGTLEIWGDGSVVRDYFHVRDLAGLCLRGVTATEAVTVNAGSGMGLSLLEILSALERATGRTITPIFRAARAVDLPVSVLDISRARQVFGWVPRIGLEEGLAETWDWVQMQP